MFNKLFAFISIGIGDYAIFLVKLFLDGAKDGILVALASVAVVADLLSPDRKQKFFYSVMRLGERFDLWLNLHGALEKGQDSGDGLFGGSAAGSDTLPYTRIPPKAGDAARGLP